MTVQPAHDDLARDAVASLAAGDLDAAERAFAGIVAADPRAHGAWHALAKIAARSGNPDAALERARRAHALDRRNPEYLNTMGIALGQCGQLEAAVAAFRRALRERPPFADAHNNLGLALRLQGREEEAVACFQHALAVQPGDPIAAHNLGLALQALGRLDEARESLQSAVARHPEFAEAHSSLGVVLKQQGQLDRAEAALSRAVALQPSSAEILTNLGSVLQLLGRPAEAIARFESARAIEPDAPATLTNLGLAYLAEGRLRDALGSLERCAALRPDQASAQNNLGLAFRSQGDVARAQQCFRAALALDPSYAPAHSNLLFCLNYLPAVPPGEVLAQHRRFGERFEAPLERTRKAHANPRDPDKRLRIGYVSGDLREHAMAFSITPVLAAHDRTRVEVFCYANNARSDAVTARLRGLTDQWHGVVGLGDEAMADLVRAHGIDILVDLAGHTALNRLLVFARKPAPVQVAWLGYVATTGLSAIDFRVTDARLDPPERAERHTTETLVHLPSTIVFEPPPDGPTVNALPALAAETFTFASLNHPAKVTPEVVALWAEILAAVPEGRLLLGSAGDAAVRDRLLALFGRHGIAPSRLDFLPKLPLADYLGRHHAIDLALDPFPYNGGATSCHSLWMGVPFVTLVGDRYVSRMGLSVLETVGLGEFAAQTPAGYVALAVRVARERARLATIRTSLRERLTASPLLDAKGFTRNLEAAFRAMWKGWCETRDRADA